MNNRKGMTAMVDAMIFIVIMGLAVTAIFALDDEEITMTNESSEICKELLLADLKLCDVMDTEDESGIMMPDLMAACTMSDKISSRYITDVLDSITKRPDSYRMTIEYDEKEMVLGTGDGIPLSGYTTKSPVSFGGSVRITLNLY